MPRRLCSIKKVKNKEANKIYALKQISLIRSDNKELDSIKNEICALSSITYKNIANYYGSYTDENIFTIFMKYYEEPDLKKNINDYKKIIIQFQNI